jgi:hypothetical protein
MSDRKLEAAIGNGEDLVVTDAMRRAVRREECDVGGHTFDVMTTDDGSPIILKCARCGRGWNVFPP